MTSTTLQVAALQTAAHDRSDFDAAWPRILDAASRAVEGGDVDLLVMPEATIPGYVLGGTGIDESATKRAVEQLARLAAGTSTAIVCGAVVRSGEHLRNAAVAIDRDGTIAGRADKTFLWHFDRMWFEAADCIEPIRTSIGTIGALVCADGRIPTIARALVDRGAQILVMPTAWVSSGRDPGALENVQADLLARVRAYENGVPFVAANKCGVEMGIALYCGKSQLVDAGGRILAMAGEREPGTIGARVAISPARGPSAAASVPAPAPALPLPERPVRVAITALERERGDAERVQWLGAACTIAPGGSAAAELGRIVPAARAGDADVLDPGGIAAMRLAGYRAIVWETAGDAWTRDLARARALESRVYVVVLALADRRAFAVDPDGVVVCGTFGDYRIASFDLDGRKTELTAVAPHTDVVEGFDLVAGILGRNEEAR